MAEATALERRTSEQFARLWIEAWNSGNPQDLPLADNFTHTSPLGELKGREAYLEKVIPLSAANVDKLKVIRILGSRNEAAVYYEVTNAKGVTPCCDWLHVANGKILSVQAFFDTASLSNSEGY